jgi:hypothetical protein
VPLVAGVDSSTQSWQIVHRGRSDGPVSCVRRRRAPHPEGGREVDSRALVAIALQTADPPQPEVSKSVAVPSAVGRTSSTA